MTPQFITIDFDTWPRSDYFHYYIERIKCKYTLNAELDLTPLMRVRSKKQLKFFPTLLYAIIRAVNQNTEFRMAYGANKQLGYWNYVVPSYTIFHEDDKTFSDVWSEYDIHFPTFYQHVISDMETYKDVKGIKAKPNQPRNFCSISCIPWLSFTSFAQDTYEESEMLFPLIRFGKYFERNQQTLLPLAVFVNHAVADGYHSSKLINDIQDLINRIDEWVD